MAHTTLKVQVVGALFCHGDDQLPPLCCDSLSGNLLSKSYAIFRRSSPADYTIQGHQLACSHDVSIK